MRVNQNELFMKLKINLIDSTIGNWTIHAINGLLKTYSTRHLPSLSDTQILPIVDLFYEDQTTSQFL